MNIKQILLTLSSSVVAAYLTAQVAVSSFREVFITDGETAQIGGEVYSEPGIYKVVKPDGTYEAVRLTVAPQAAIAEMTQPYLNINTPHSICVNWKTRVKPASAVVRYGRSEDNLDKSVVASSTMLTGRTHCWNTAALSGLEPETDYFYQVESGDLRSKIHHFRTMPRPEDGRKIRMLLIGDHQRNEHSDYEWMLNAARKTVERKYGEGPIENHIHFILNDGDQVDAGVVSLYEKVHIFKSRSVSPSLPTMTAVGNHELKQDPTLQIYDKHYHAYGELEYQGIQSGTANYYAYQAGCVLVIALNSDEETAAQKEWVRKVIKAASTDSSVDFIISVQHRPMYAELWTYDVSPWMLNEIMPILSSTPKHVLNYAGHHHLYARGQMTDYPCYHIISGGGVGTSVEGYDQLFGVSPDPRNHSEVQKTIDVWSYQILEFDPVEKIMTAESYSVGNSRMALDNELIDSFSRKVKGSSAVAIPVILAPENSMLQLPFTFSQQEDAASLLSTQYQISRSEEFSQPVKNVMRNVEDCFGVDEHFRPVDLNKNIDISEFTVNDGELADGTYYIRVRNRNSNLDWSEYSEPVKFTVCNGAELPQVAVERKFFAPGETVTVDYSGAPENTDAWVGIYESHITPGAGGESVYYEYTSGTKGAVNFKAERPGAYFAVLFKDGGYSETGDRAYFIVSENCDEENQPTITIDKSVYQVGEPVVVKYTNATCFNDDWVGIYRKNDVPVDSKSRSYVYVGGGDANGFVTLNVEGTSNFSGPIEEGDYYVGYFNSGGYYEPVKRCYFSVSSSAGITVPQEDVFTLEVTSNQIMIASEKGVDTVELYSMDGKRVYNRVFSGVKEASVMTELAAGSYIIVVNGSERRKITI